MLLVAGKKESVSDTYWVELQSDRPTLSQSYNFQGIDRLFHRPHISLLDTHNPESIDILHTPTLSEW